MTGKVFRLAEVVAVMALAHLAGAPAAAQDRPVFPVSKWSERGVFAFGGVNFDFFYKRWGSGPAGGPLSDCSSDANFCMDGAPFRLVLPRQCAALESAAVGSIWTEGAVRTEVLFIEKAQMPPLHGSGRSNVTYYIGDVSTPNIIFEYDRNIGVTRILRDEAKGIDFVSLARNGEISNWLYGYAFDRQKANKVHDITTFDRFGACGEVTPLSKLDVPEG